MQLKKKKTFQRAKSVWGQLSFPKGKENKARQNLWGTLAAKEGSGPVGFDGDGLKGGEASNKGNGGRALAKKRVQAGKGVGAPGKEKSKSEQRKLIRRGKKSNFPRVKKRFWRGGGEKGGSGVGRAVAAHKQKNPWEWGKKKQKSFERGGKPYNRQEAMNPTKKTPEQNRIQKKGLARKKRPWRRSSPRRKETGEKKERQHAGKWRGGDR